MNKPTKIQLDRFAALENKSLSYQTWPNASKKIPSLKMLQVPFGHL